jgi:ABC-2 type transport system permease protein
MIRRRIFNILRKEWLYSLTDMNNIFLIVLVPFLIIGQLMLFIWLAATFAGEAVQNVSIFQNAMANVQHAIPAVAALSGEDQFRVLLLSQFNFYMLLIPVMIAISLATFSIIDEKLSGSLEALLATPVRTWELLLGKALAGAIPALIMTWICSGVFLLIVTVMGWGYLLQMVMSPVWFISIFLFTPAVTVLSFLLGVIGSSTAKDSKGAQNRVLVIILPVLALVAVQITGVVWFTTISALLLGIGIVIVDFIVLRVATGLFQRESIVVSWKSS